MWQAHEEKKMYRMVIVFDCLKSRSLVVLRPLCWQDDVVSWRSFP